MMDSAMVFIRPVACRTVLQIRAEALQLTWRHILAEMGEAAAEGARSLPLDLRRTFAFSPILHQLLGIARVSSLATGSSQRRGTDIGDRLSRLATRDALVLYLFHAGPPSMVLPRRAVSVDVAAGQRWVTRRSRGE